MKFCLLWSVSIKVVEIQLSILYLVLKWKGVVKGGTRECLLLDCT